MRIRRSITPVAFDELSYGDVFVDAAYIPGEVVDDLSFYMKLLAETENDEGKAVQLATGQIKTFMIESLVVPCDAELVVQ